MTTELHALIAESINLHRLAVKHSAQYRLVPADLCITMRRVSDQMERALAAMNAENESPALRGE